MQQQLQPSLLDCKRRDDSREVQRGAVSNLKENTCTDSDLKQQDDDLIELVEV